MREPLRFVPPEKNPTPRPTMRAIAERVAARHGITVDDLTGPSARRAVSWPRQEAYWLCRQQTQPNGLPVFSLPRIGRFFGGRDHTTVRYGAIKHEERLAMREAAE